MSEEISTAAQHVGARDAPPADDLGQIGRRLHGMRTAQRMTLEQLASDTGLSIGYLSQIENGGAIPSLTALQVLAAALGVDVAAFFPDESRRGTRVITAAERDLFRIDPGSAEEYSVLAGQVTDRAFSALSARHERTSEGRERPFRHLGEEFVLTLSGTLQITVDGEEFDLGAGDWIHYSSHPAHSAEVVSDEPVEALWLLTPAVI